MTKCVNCKQDTNNPKFCSKSCSASFNNRITKVKSRGTCKYCNKDLTKTNRTYCSNQCQANYNKQKVALIIEANRPSSHNKLRNYLIQKFGPVCMECGWSKKNPITKKVPIEIDHKDGNSQNNTLNNVRLLCPNCQSLTPTYKALNKGNGRAKRMDRYRAGKSF
jgi:hypothetical protein